MYSYQSPQHGIRFDIYCVLSMFIYNHVRVHVNIHVHVHVHDHVHVHVNVHLHYTVRIYVNSPKKKRTYTQSVVWFIFNLQRKILKVYTHA